jgi:hypothetical protein
LQTSTRFFMHLESDLVTVHIRDVVIHQLHRTKSNRPPS